MNTIVLDEIETVLRQHEERGSDLDSEILDTHDDIRAAYELDTSPVIWHPWTGTSIKEYMG